MKLSELYTIKPIDRKLANEIQIKNHYLKTRASCTFAFGLYENNSIIGVILYGNPTAPTTLDICGESNRKNVVEITRLWIQDNTPKNTESFFISNTIKLINKPIIVAFADPDAGHIGTIYQAANFLYTGKSDRGGKVIAIKNNNIHNKTLWKQYKTAERIREVFGIENVYYKPYSTKYRYVYLKEKRFSMDLKYDIAPYPKK
jgi:hypothetical protein